MDRHPQNDWGTVTYDVRLDEYWLPAGGAKQLLFYCPWCGERLPESQRDLWYDELGALGIDPNFDPIPQDYKTGAWRGAASVDSSVGDREPIEGRIIILPDLTFDNDA